MTASCPPTPPPRRSLPLPPPTATELSRLDHSLRGLAAAYDDAEHMTTTSIASYSPGYSTRLKTGTGHPTRESLHYALGLLDTHRGGQAVETACHILARVLPLQDKDQGSKTWGTWPWFLEESLSEMANPDMNWADFNGLTLLQVLRDHESRLPPHVASQVRDSILHAARAIKRRNVGPSYTNVAVLGTYVTLIAGELLGEEDLRAYGVKRLRTFHRYTTESGGFQEYNSPPYLTTTLQELTRLRAHVQDQGSIPLIDDITRRLWEELASHFHPPTLQWAGPYSRAYSSLLRKNILSIIQQGSHNTIDFHTQLVPDREERRTSYDCPHHLWPLFTALPAPRTVTCDFIASTRTIGTTYLHPAFALGSINHGDMWNQRRALIAHFNSPAAPMYLHLRFLKDGYDFASAYLTSTQREGTVVGAVTLLTDGGDTHISNHKVKGESITARDLRLRFEVGGAVPASIAATTCVVVEEGGGMIKDALLPGQQQHPGSPAAPLIGAATITGSNGSPTFHITIPFARLGDSNGRVSAGAANNLKYIDVELYNGAGAMERTFDLAALHQAAVGFVMTTTVATGGGGSGGGVEAVVVREGGDGGQRQQQQPQQVKRGLLSALMAKTTAAVSGSSSSVGGSGGGDGGGRDMLRVSFEGMEISVPVKPLKSEQRVKMDST